MQNLKITAKMFTATSFIDPPNLDALLLYEYSRQFDEKFFYRNIHIDDFDYPEGFENVIKKVEFDETDWFYACSDCQYIIDKVTTGFWNRRTDDIQLDYIYNHKKKLDTGRGFFRNYRMPLILNYVKEFVWYIVGDWNNIKFLTDNITNLGKKHTSQGSGTVKEWIIEEVKEDYSIYKDNCLIKTIPVSYHNMDAYNIMLKPYRPPYFLRPPHPKASIEKCYMPSGDR
jgi:CRISPR type IV-associated protein Csf3